VPEAGTTGKKRYDMRMKNYQHKSTEHGCAAKKYNGGTVFAKKKNDGVKTAAP